MELSEAEVQGTIQNALTALRAGRHLDLPGGISVDPCVLLGTPKGMTDSQHIQNVWYHLSREVLDHYRATHSGRAITR
jgi:hypothetical protein